MTDIIRTFVICALAFPAVASLESPMPNVNCRETMPDAKMSATADDPTRGPGPFGKYWWANRFLSRLEQGKALQGKCVDLLMIGDSIIHFWEWKHPASWQKFVNGRTVLNCGYGGDCTQNVLWRIEHGEIDGFAAKNIVVMIGTNNNTFDTSNPTNVAFGIEAVVAAVRAHQPNSQIILHPIFPRGSSGASKLHAMPRQRNEVTNRLLREFAMRDGKVTWVDFNEKLIDGTGWVPTRLMADEIHPTDECYDIWMSALEPVLRD